MFHVTLNHLSNIFEVTLKQEYIIFQARLKLLFIVPESGIHLEFDTTKFLIIFSYFDKDGQRW